MANDDKQITVPLVYMTAGLFLVSLISVVIVVVMSIDIPTEIGIILGTVVGATLNNYQQIINFFFGSSAGSKRKTEMLDEEAEVKNMFDEK